jgi:hypothetical protein
MGLLAGGLLPGLTMPPSTHGLRVRVDLLYGVRVHRRSQPE